MQNQQQMPAMANMNAAVASLDGTPIMGNGQRQPGPGSGTAFPDPHDQLNTYIYDYFLRNQNHRLARMMIECDLKMNLKPPQKSSPSGRNVNGVDPMDQDTKDLPAPNIPQTSGHAMDNSFLLDWWVQFWDIFSAARNRSSTTKGTQYISHARNVMNAQTDSRNQRMMMNGNINAAQYQSMMRAMPNGVPPNDLKRAAAMNSRPNGNPMANMNPMKSQAMMSQQMQRDGSQMDMNGQRPQSPSSNENGGSPNKRPRVEGAMNGGNMPGNQFGEFAQQGPQKQIEVYAQSLAQQQRMALNNHTIAQGMNNGAQGSPMNQQGLAGEADLFVGNQPRPGIPAGAPGPPQGNHALQDYQMQLMLLEQQNKKRLLMARQEQDMSGPHAQAAVGGPGFPPSMSPQGSRAGGPSPNPSDQMKKGATPRMGQQGLPGSPMPEGAMPPQRNSPAPGVAFDPNQMPPGMPPQYTFSGPMGNNPMMRPPPSSHPQFNGQPMSAQQIEAMRATQLAAMQNGGWRGPQGQPGVMQGQPAMGPMGNNPQQRSQMPPPPAPAGEQPRAQEPSPSQPAQAPPTPSQTSKANPKKKNSKDNKKPANNKKGANTGATPAASGGEEPATPTAPITPVHPKPFPQGANGQPQPQAAQQQQPPAQQQPPMDNNFGNLGDDPNFDNLGLAFDDQNALENFDFDSFLHVGDDSTAFGSLGTDFGFGDTVEAGID